MSNYDIAMICLNGHVINSRARRFPQWNAEYCEKCGSKTIVKCEQCHAFIRGKYGDPDPTGYHETTYIKPKFCQKCGHPYPWTKASIKAVKEFIEEELDLSKDDKTTLASSVDILACDNPQTQVVASRFKRIASNIGSESLKAFKDILVNVLSETAKKIIFPGL